ncbi:hypothetical protein SLEP1_g58641 [Rubroshorea leprosula]|uniref:Uncharacterized protein n=1 Tax=Rubroshorea leprosula TaxID=152421 RepID=A0AAV5MSE1_9ROSI|nr:hypothetical protein SLEP1_g58641 [Rubroshorea leprosula]
MDGASQPSTSTSSAFSFISKGWREVRDSADADLRLMKDRAKSFKNLAASFDRELENLINSAPTFAVPAIRSSSEMEFMKKLQPKISELQPKFSEFRKVYSAPEISRKVMEKWRPRAKIGIDLSEIRNAIVAEVQERDTDGDGIVRFDRIRKGRRIFAEDEQFGDWKPIRALKTRLREFDRRRSISSSVEIFSGIRYSEFVEKVKSSLVSFLSLSFLHLISKWGFSGLGRIILSVKVLIVADLLH